MEIVNIEVEHSREMVTAWNSLKSELKELQNIYLRKEPDEWLDSKKSVRYFACLRSLQHLRNSGTLSFTPDRQKKSLSKQDVVSLLTTVQKKKIVMERSLPKRIRKSFSSSEIKRISTFIDAKIRLYTIFKWERFLTDTEL